MQRVRSRAHSVPRSLLESVEEFYATLDHEIFHYTDSRIMPRFFARAGAAHGARTQGVGIIRGSGDRRADFGSAQLPP